MSDTPTATPQNAVAPAGVTLDLSKSTPVAQPYSPPAGVTLDLSKSTPIPATSTGSSTESSAQPGVLSRSWEGAKQFAAPIAELVKPPETPTEQLVHAIGGGGGALAAYRTAKNIVSSVENAVKATPGEYKDAASNVVRAVQDFHNKDYRNALSDAVSAGTVLAPTIVPGGSATRELAEGARPGGNLATPLTRDALTIGSALIGGAAAAPEEEAATAAASRLKVNPFRAKVQSALATPEAAGAAAAQPTAQAAVEDAATAAAKDSGVSATTKTGGFRTALDDTLAKTAKIERAQYDQINEAAGMDLKNLYEREGELQDALDDPTNIVQRPAIQTELARTRMQIANGESKAAESGVNAQKAVRQAKDLTQQRFALQDLKAKLFNNESVITGNATAGTPETINVDSAIKAVERLDKPSRYAPEGTRTRLQQALGEDGATKLKQNLYDAQRAGQSAMDSRALRNKVLTLLGVGGGVVEGVHLLTK